jgi:hypothetical protein
MIPEPDPQTLGLRTFPGVKLSLDHGKPEVDLINPQISSLSGVVDVPQGSKQKLCYRLASTAAALRSRTFR